MSSKLNKRKKKVLKTRKMQIIKNQRPEKSKQALQKLMMKTAHLIPKMSLPRKLKRL